MGIGTSQGAFYEDEGHYHASMWDDRYDDNVIDVSDKGKDKMPFPDNNNPNTDFNTRFGNLPPNGILNDLKKPSEGVPLVRRINDVTDAPERKTYDTSLTSEEETGFKDWKSKYAPNDSGQDYDLRGAFINGVTPGDNGHLPDTYKKPNHPTFSEESMYSMPGQIGGKWSDGGKTFTPGEANLRENGLNGIAEYLQKNDPDVKINIAGNKLDYKQANEIYNAVGRPNFEVNTPYNVFHSDVVNKLLGTNGEDRYQLWPERMLRDLVTTAGKVNKGEVPMWAIDPETGEMHTSLDAMQAAWSMMPGANSATVGAAGAVARAGMEARSGIGKVQDVVEGSSAERKAVLSSDRLYVGRGSQEELDTALGRNGIRPRLEDVTPTRATEDNYLAGGYHPEEARALADHARSLRNSLEDLPRYHSPAERDALAREASPPQLLRKQGKISLMTNNTGRGAFSDGGDHMYYFKTDGDKIGKVDVSIKKDGKELYIHGIAGVGRDRGAGNFGTRDMIDLVKALRKEHPGTTSIGGFRISGARRKSALDQGDSGFHGSDAHSNFTTIAEPD